MKGNYILLACMLTGITASAQKKTGTATTDVPVTIAKTAEVTGFQSNLSDGALVFTKILKKDHTGNFAASYTLLNTLSSFNGGKPFEIKLNKASFDDYFQTSSPELAKQWARFIRYAQDKKMSFSDEKTWVELITQYNNSK